MAERMIYSQELPKNMVMVGLALYSLFFFMQLINCQKTHENYRPALFARPEIADKNEGLYKKVSENLTASMDKTVEQLIKWLQEKFYQSNRIVRQENPSIIKETLKHGNYGMKPQPFTITKSSFESGYPIYSSYPTPQFYPYNQTQYTTNEGVPSSSSEYPLTYPLAESESASDSVSLADATETNNFRAFETKTGNNADDLMQDSVPNDTISNQKPDDNVINELETTSHQLPHIHSIDVQCSKDKMVINIEFNEIYNGIVYSKGFYNEPNCHYVRQNSGQIKYSFVVQLNSCGTQFVDEFYKGKQAFLENVLVLQNEPGIQEVWDTVRSVRCLWEGSIKQTLSAGLNVETLNQDILTFSGDMIAARLEIQVGKGPNAPAANGLVKIGDTMTLVVTVDGDSSFDILVRSCMATDGNPNSGNLIQLTDDQGCILKPKLFSNFQMIKNSDSNRPSVVAYAYFQAFKFPDVMDLLIECNVELCKSQCQTCQQSSEPVRQKRLVDNNINSYPLNATKFLREKIHVMSNEDLKFVSTSLFSDLYLDTENQICFTVAAFYLQNTIIAMLFCSSCIIIICFWIKLKRLSDNSDILY